MAKPLEVTDETFAQEVLKATQPVLVDFWAPWCGPCRMVAPIVEELTQEYEGRVTFAKVNTDENLDVALRYGIRSIPTLMVFKEGKAVSTVIGYRPKNELRKHIEAALNQGIR